ncbi:MAG: hypothetical protein V7K40_17085 [Nostoc sp.]|uniref:hypothetical protein n=1 Tax=Nostoc sp. TaxID=1180 RepID=UPI002FF95B0A
MGKGESEAIALKIELNADYILLDDSTARREAKRLGLSIKGTLAVIKKIKKDGKISIESLDSLYQKIIEIEFKVKGSNGTKKSYSLCSIIITGIYAIKQSRSNCDRYFL